MAGYGAAQSGAYLEGDSGEAPEASKLGQVHEDGAGAGQRQHCNGGRAPLVVVDPQPTDVLVQERPQCQQRPALHVCELTMHLFQRWKCQGARCVRCTRRAEYSAHQGSCGLSCRPCMLLPPLLHLLPGAGPKDCKRQLIICTARHRS